MGTLQKCFLSARTPLVEFRRFRGKINIQRPRKMHYERQLVTDLCRPMLPKKLPALQAEMCWNLKDDPRKQKPDNPFEHILAKEALNWFNHSRMITFYHFNPYPMEEMSKVYAQLTLRNMYIRQYGIDVLRLALVGTKYEGILPVFVSHTNMIFSDKVQLRELLKITKKAHPMVLLGGIVEGKFLSKNEIVHYSTISSITDLQSQMCQVLESGPANLVELFTQHQNELVANLDAYVQMKQSGDETKEANSNAESDAAPSSDLNVK